MSQENLIRLRCDVCKNKGYFSTRNKKKLKEKLEMKKFCSKCRKHTLHKEIKLKGK